MNPVAFGASLLVFALIGAGTGIYLVKLRPRRDPVAEYVTIGLFVFACSIGMSITGFWPPALGLAALFSIYLLNRRQRSSSD